MTEDQFRIEQYKRRWLNLLLFVMFSINNGIHWVQYSVINDTIANYYKIPAAYVEWTTALYTLTYVVFIVPGLYMLEKIKMRYIVILVSSLSTTATWIKVFTVHPDRFPFALFAQILLSISYTFTYGVSGRLTATWFGMHEISRASALSLFGDQFGGSLSFIIPVLMVRRSSDVTIVENSMRKMHIMNACLSSVFLLLIVTLFKDKPKNPPSKVEAQKADMEKETFTHSFRKMAKNRAFMMLLFSYGFCGAILFAVSTFLGEIVVKNFPEAHEDAGKIGFLSTLLGMFTSPVFSYILDKTHHYKGATIILSTGALISHLLFTITLKMNNIIYVYIFSIFSGMFTMSSYVNGIQIGIEILYPISEEKCSSMMVFVIQITGFIFIQAYGTLLRTYDDLAANSFLCVMAFIGAATSFFVPVKLNRQEAEHDANSKEMKPIF